MWYKVKIKPLSSILSDLSSDILWGHLMWAIRYVISEDKLKQVIDDTKEGNGLFCSSLFPIFDGREFFPALKLPAPKEKAEKHNIEVKELKKIRFVPQDIIIDMKDSFSLDKYFNLLIGELKSGLPTMFHQEVRMRNVINRRSNTVQKGGLFSTRPMAFVGDMLYFFIHWPYEEKDLYSILEFLSSSGYGADKSVGLGHIEIDLNKDVEKLAEDFFDVDGANAFIGLSLGIVEESEVDLSRSFYKIKSKIGRLGEAFANIEPYYKRPLWFMEEGSILCIKERKKVYGKLEENVHPNRDIVHYGITVPYKIKMEEF